jgi:hypothetical protein
MKFFSRGLPILVLVPGLCVYLANPHLFSRSPHLWVAAAALTIATANLAWTIQNLYAGLHDAGHLASLGLRRRWSIVGVIISVAAVGLAEASVNGAADIASILSIVACIGSVAVSTKVRVSVAAINERIEIPSRHLTWRDDIARAAVHASNPTSRDQILKLSHDAEFLARDVNGTPTALDAEIEAEIGRVREAAIRGEDDLLQVSVNRIQQYFEEREVLLKAQRRQA